MKIRIFKGIKTLALKLPSEIIFILRTILFIWFFLRNKRYIKAFFNFYFSFLVWSIFNHRRIFFNNFFSAYLPTNGGKTILFFIKWLIAFLFIVRKIWLSLKPFHPRKNFLINFVLNLPFSLKLFKSLRKCIYWASSLTRHFWLFFTMLIYWREHWTILNSCLESFIFLPSPLIVIFFWLGKVIWIFLEVVIWHLSKLIILSKTTSEQKRCQLIWNTIN